ncbi:MAG: hypothetical protein KAR38_00225, partial [Calditrichia bacterium]|nr:hypothetical protein [Calditrichia bacterium]
MSKNRSSILLFPQFSTKIGYGHLKRSLLLSNILKPYYNIKMILYKNNVPLNIDYKFFNSYYDIIKFTKSFKPAFLILDFRYYSKKLIKILSSNCKLIIIDSLKTFNNDKYILYINSTTPLNYKYLNNNINNYEGLKYLPLKSDLIKYRLKPQKKNKRIFISFGNSDPNQLSFKTLKAVKNDIKAYKIIITIGKYYDTQYRLKLIKYIINNFTNYKILEDTNNLIQEMSECEYLITSYGITALEGLILSNKTGLFNNSGYHTELSKLH